MICNKIFLMINLPIWAIQVITEYSWVQFSQEGPFSHLEKKGWQVLVLTQNPPKTSIVEVRSWFAKQRGRICVCVYSMRWYFLWGWLNVFHIHVSNLKIATLRMSRWVANVIYQTSDTVWGQQGQSSPCPRSMPWCLWVLEAFQRAHKTASAPLTCECE